MNYEEYKNKMKELGWPDEYINDQIKLHKEAEKNGIEMSFEKDLIKAPIQY